jgi:hypothetical protein
VMATSRYLYQQSRGFSGPFRGVGRDAAGLMGLLALVGMGLNHDSVFLHRMRSNKARGMEREAEARASECHHS